MVEVDENGGKRVQAELSALGKIAIMFVTTGTGFPAGVDVKVLRRTMLRKGTGWLYPGMYTE